MPSPPPASRALLTAAVCGLLGACGGQAVEQEPPLGCDDPAATPTVTASRVLEDMTLEQFSEACEARHGTLEIHPHCGGVNSCRGMSFDETIQTFTEHTCRGQNTCAGYSCIIC